MRAALSLITITAATLWATPAFAGGLGPLVVGGVHTESVHYYSSRADGGAGPAFSDWREYEQTRSTQLIGNVGTGLELVLGDRNDAIQGVFRGYWQMDAPQYNPGRRSNIGISSEALVAPYRAVPRHTGVGTVGLQVRLLSFAEEKGRFGLSTHLGAGFASPTHEEFFIAQVGTNIAYRISRTLEVFGDLTYGFRVRKTISHGAYTAAGLRILFD